MIFVIDITKDRQIQVALCGAPNIVEARREIRRRKYGPNLVQPNGGSSTRL